VVGAGVEPVPKIAVGITLPDKVVGGRRADLRSRWFAAGAGLDHGMMPTSLAVLPLLTSRERYRRLVIPRRHPPGQAELPAWEEEPNRFTPHGPWPASSRPSPA
jgi:hypothetical protein